MSLRGYPFGSSSAATTVPGCRPDDLQRFETNFLDQGVVKGNGSELAVVQHAAGANMSVDVGTGAALISVLTTLLTPDYTLKTWLTNDAVIVVSVPTADNTNPRIDRIIAKFDPTVDPNGAASNIVSIELVEGTPAGSPSAPATPANAISLATVAVAASETAIETSHITDTREFVQVTSTSLSDLVRKVGAQGDAVNWLGTITGTDTLTGEATPSLTAYSAGQRFAFVGAAHNTGAVTLNIDSLGAKAIKKLDGATDLAANDVQDGQIVMVQYDGTNFQMLSPVANVGSIATVNLLYSNTADSNTISNTTTETDFNTQYTVPANDWLAGGVYRIRIYISTVETGTTTNVRVYLGSDVIAATGDTQWGLPMMVIDCHILCLTTGASGTIVSRTFITGYSGSMVNKAQYIQEADTIDTTATKLIKVSVKNSHSQANYMTVKTMTIEKLT